MCNNNDRDIPLNLMSLKSTEVSKPSKTEKRLLNDFGKALDLLNRKTCLTPECENTVSLYCNSCQTDHEIDKGQLKGLIK